MISTRVIRGLGVIIAYLITFNSALGQNRDSYIFPDPAHRIVLAVQDSCADSILCGRVLPESNPTGGYILAQLQFPYHQSVIAISQGLRNFVGDSSGPNLLFLSGNEGGYPRMGLILDDGTARHFYPHINFVDLVLNEERLKDGALSIYSHELGHVMMSIIGLDFPFSPDTKQHVSMGVTDYTIAFMEGWGEHFQRLAYDNVELYHAQFDSKFQPGKIFNRLWHSNLDEELRILNVSSNGYIYRKLLPEVDTAGMSLAQLIYLEHTSPIFDPCRLKSAQAMLSCEGVLATLFYRFDTDSLLTNNYREKAFYDHFLLKPLPESIDVKSVFSPLENVLLKNAYVWSRMKGHINDSTAPIVEFVKTWGEIFPDEKKKIVSLFLLTTVGKTVNDNVGRIYEETAYSGMIGNINKYRELASQFMTAFSALRDSVLDGQLVLDANIGPQLWVENKDFLIPQTIFFPEPTAPLNVNLNTASVFELAALKGMSMESAAKLITERDRRVFFKSLDEVKSLGFGL